MQFMRAITYYYFCDTELNPGIVFYKIDGCLNINHKDSTIITI